MKHMTIQVGGFEVNCSILSDKDRAWIIDPGQEAERIVALLTEQGLHPQAILLTHAHFDHIGAIPTLQQTYPDLKVCVHKNDVPVITHALNQLPPDYPPIARPQNLVELEASSKIEGLADLEIIESPGHTPGGVCYFFKADKLLLSGDTLFASSIGRTDLPGGDMTTLMASLRRLTNLPDDTLVIPGHGPFTTIAAEKRDNPFLQYA